MKLFVTLLLQSLLFQCVNAQINNATDSFYIIDVVEIDNYYLITAQKNTLYYKFASRKVENQYYSCDEIRHARKITPGNWYYISDYKYSPSETTISGKRLAPNLAIREIRLDKKTSLPLENLFQRRIYFSKKIIGLCIEESNFKP